jgi:hypothetical protein
VGRVVWTRYDDLYGVADICRLTLSSPSERDVSSMLREYGHVSIRICIPYYHIFYCDSLHGLAVEAVAEHFRVNANGSRRLKNL